VYGKGLGPRITSRHERYHGHNYYGIPIDCDDPVNRERLPRDVL
jgi:hypothetical protein